MTTNQPDLLETWKGEVQRMSQDRDALRQGVSIMKRRAAREAQEAAEAREGHKRTQDQVSRLTEDLRGARESLEKMHVKGCLRIGHGCPACEALDDLDSY